jgi:hypothetical protein
MTALLHKAGFEITGMEPDQIGFEIVRKENPDIPFDDIGVYDNTPVMGKFDTVISSKVIEQLFDPDSLSHVSKIHLRDGGYPVLTSRTMNTWEVY